VKNWIPTSGAKILGRIKVFILAIVFTSIVPARAFSIDAQTLIEESFNYIRGNASVSLVQMTIHRPRWERQITIKAWTRGNRDSLFYIISPPKDRGNGTLKRAREMWMYNPKINRVIKVPPSMMSQAWMGSDFSNNDLAKSDSLLTDYVHTIIGKERAGDKIVYVVQSIPKPDAPVIWGMQHLKIREDLIWLEETFFDEDLQPVKVMKTLQIQKMGGRLYPRVWRMQKAGETDRYTEITYLRLEFKERLPERLFTLSYLRNPRR